jgi:hypothetical protein
MNQTLCVDTEISARCHARDEYIDIVNYRNHNIAHEGTTRGAKNLFGRGCYG